MEIKNINKLFYYSIYLLLFAGCAKIVTPTGGPKDEEHPLIVKSQPPFNTINFDEEEINITFNEFIQLKDLNSSLIISPPVDEKPDIKVKGKILNIKFNSPLKDSTTYNIYFGNAVQDYNEGNPIENFQYVLSTGEYIDSLSIKGKVLNSFTLLPEKDVYVMLYSSLEDSVPLKQVPDYLSKTNEEGLFKINNIRLNKYKLFCVRDLNKNYLFDMPGEEIAFIDSLVKFDLITETIVDTIYKQDTLQAKTTDKELSDTVKSEVNKEIDTIMTSVNLFYPVHDYILMLFGEENEVQYLANNKRDIRQKIEFMFNKPVKDSIIFSLADTSIQESWYIKEQNEKNDTIIYWLTDSTIYNKEKLNTTITYQKEDSNLVYQWVTDTLTLRFFEPRKRKKQPVDTLLEYKTNIKNRSTFDLNKYPAFTFETPIQKVDTSKINLIATPDSLEFPVKYSFIKDSINLRKYHMLVNWAEDTIHRLEIYPQAFYDIYGNTNDTSIIEFRTQKMNYYGKVFVNVTGIDSSSYQLITQLLIPNDEKETLYKEKIIQSNQVVEFDYLPPKEFIFKVIIDQNFNGKWNTGEYIEHIQPEEVLYYKEKIKVRSNWDIEVSFDVNKK